jgi:hypothetical protein
VKPGGSFAAMLYNRNSINYYVEIMFLRRLGRMLLRPAWAPGMIARVVQQPREKLEGHRRNLLRIPHPTHEQWVSMNTDGPDCPLARVYSAGEARALFSGFANVRTEVHLFDRSHWPLIERGLPTAPPRRSEGGSAGTGWSTRISRGREPGRPHGRVGIAGRRLCCEGRS